MCGQRRALRPLETRGGLAGLERYVEEIISREFSLRKDATIIVLSMKTVLQHDPIRHLFLKVLRLTKEYIF